MLYAMLIPGIVYITVFKYVPMYGVSIAFKDYNGFGKIAEAEWVGLKNFRRLFETNAFRRAFYNNIIISLAKLVFGFPAPIILALMIDGIRTKWAKRIVQTSVILPDFVSWVVIYGLMYAIFSPNTGVIRQVASVIGYNGKLPNLLADKETFRAVIVGSHVWKGMGIGTVTYLAAITGIDQQLYDAATIDGAGRWQKTWHITLTGIRGVIITLLIIRIGHIMNAGFSQIFAISNSAVVSVADIIDTYVYRIGLTQGRFSLATAAGLFKSVIGLVLVLFTNWISKKVDPDSGIM